MKNHNRFFNTSTTHAKPFIRATIFAWGKM